MIGALNFLCLILLGAALGAGVVIWFVARTVTDPSRFAKFLSGYLVEYSRAIGHPFLSTVDDEGRLVRIPVDRLARSLEAQLPIWAHPAARPPEHIHFDPPEGSH